ncbi:MAG: aspartate kinase, partial [Bacteroidales bacterium]|nr:aspartate kinase [Bacteroidales bacterium]
MKVLKFGGSSVGNPERIRGVRKIVESESSDCIVVVSAFEGITDKLKKTSELAAEGNTEYLNLFNEIVSLHESYVQILIEQNGRNEVLSHFRNIFNETADTLRGIFLLRELSRKASDKVLSTGERASSFIISRYFGKGLLLDAREFIRTDDNFGNANVDFDITHTLIKEKFYTDEKIIIVPGFIGSTPNNETTTLGRGGSDYTAAIIASVLEAESLEIWTDTDGFMTADPRKVDKAYAIDSLTYSEAIELSHFGAKVIYTPTLRPVYRKKIPVHVKNSFDPSKKGTLISEKPGDDGISPIKGISSIDHIDLITLQGTAMVGVSGTSMRLFGALARQNVNVILITQASSEYSITFALNPPDTAKAVTSIKAEFEKEIVYSRELNIL